MKAIDLKIEVVKSNLKQFEVAQELNLNPTAFNKMVNGQREIPKKVRKKLVELFPNLKNRN